MKRTAALICALSVLFTLRGQEQKEYALRELLEIGLENNYSVKIARGNEQISDNNVTLANAGFLPVVDISGGYSGVVNNTRTTSTGDVVTTDNGVMNQSANVGVDASWYIFDGFRIQTNYKRLQELQMKGELNTRITVEDFVASLSARYYSLIQEKIRLGNMAYAIALSAERLRIAEVRYEIGSGSRPDVLQAQVDYNADSSRYIGQLTAVHESMVNLNEMLANKDVDARVALADTAIIINEMLDYAALEDGTMRINASLLASESDMVIAELDLKLLQSRNYPYIRMGTGYGYGWNRYGSGNTRQRGNLGFNVGATVGMTIFNGNRRREQTNARITIDNSHLRKEQLENSLRADLSTLWQAYVNNLDKYRMEKENVIVALENYKIARDRYYEIGNLSGIEMREAQRSLLDAQERLLSSSYSTKICEISLLQLSGRIFEYMFN